MHISSCDLFVQAATCFYVYSEAQTSSDRLQDPCSRRWSTNLPAS